VKLHLLLLTNSLVASHHNTIHPPPCCFHSTLSIILLGRFSLLHPRHLQEAYSVSVCPSQTASNWAMGNAQSNLPGAGGAGDGKDKKDKVRMAVWYLILTETDKHE
jgi:hypothetical protein